MQQRWLAMPLAGVLGVLSAVSLTDADRATSDDAPPATTRAAAANTVTVGDRPAGAVTTRRVSDARFSAIGVTWSPHDTSSDDPPTVQVRARTSAGWDSWEQLHHGEDGGLDSPRAGTEPLWVGSSDAAEIRIAGGQARDVQIHLIDPGVRVTDELASETAPTQRYASRNDERVALPAYSRGQWGADESWMSWAPEYASEVKAVTVHHTATRNAYEAEEVPAILRSIYHFHAIERGWGDIGYNVLVDRFGRAWEGRAGGLDQTLVGAHAGGFNTGTSGISMIGNYDVTWPSGEVLETVARWAAYKLTRYGYDPNTDTELSGGPPSDRYPEWTTITTPRVFPHQTTSRTACPGQYLLGGLTAIRERASVLGSLVDLTPA